MKKRYISPPELKLKGASNYEAEITAEGVFLYRLLSTQEIQQIDKCKNMPWRFDSANNRLFIGNVKTSQNATKTVQAYWNKLKKI